VAPKNETEEQNRIKIIINGTEHNVNVDENTPLNIEIKKGDAKHDKQPPGGSTGDNRDKFVTSSAIRKAGDDCAGRLSDLALKMQKNVDKTTVPAPGFGLLGIGIQDMHTAVQQYTRDYLDAAAKAARTIGGQLHSIADTWRNAEEKSTVKYQ
jgi:hypothetical protein